MRVAVIGTGHLGKQHARVYAELPDVELVGVVDLDPDAAAAAAARAQCPVLPGIDAAIAAAEALSVCVPTPQHAEVARRCLEAGRHVLIEKPITDDLAEARRLRDLAARGERILQVGHIERFNPAMLAVAPHLRAPRFVECHRMARFGRRGADVAVVLDLMIHDLDLLLAVLHDEVQSIDAAGVAVLSGSTDIANVRLRFRNGCVANVTASRISLEPMRKIRFFQPDSYVSVDLLRERVAMYRRRDGFDAAAFRDALHRGDNPSLLEAVEPVPLAVESAEPLALELSSFVDAVRHGKRPRVGADEGIRALEVAMEIERLLREEDPVAGADGGRRGER